MSLLLLGLLAPSATGCAAEEGAQPRLEGSELIAEGVSERVAGEPIFDSELAELVAGGLSEERARSHLRRVALLSAAARSADGLVSPRALELARRRAAVQLYLDEIRSSVEPPSEAELRERHEVSGDERLFFDVKAELRETVSNERTFARILELVRSLDEELAPEVSPEALPAPDELDFADGAP